MDRSTAAYRGRAREVMPRPSGIKLGAHQVDRVRSPRWRARQFTALHDLPDPPQLPFCHVSAYPAQGQMG